LSLAFADKGKERSGSRNRPHGLDRSKTGKRE
jgi:hypothetical protein